jgi:hypothetical protein
MSRKYQVKMVYLPSAAVILMFDGCVGKGNVERKTRKALNRVLFELETHERFVKDWEERADVIQGGRPFDFKAGKDGLLVKIRREDRKPLYDLFVDKPMAKDVSRTYMRKAEMIARALGMLATFRDIDQVQEIAAIMEEKEEEEVVEDWGDDDEEEEEEEEETPKLEDKRKQIEDQKKKEDAENAEPAGDDPPPGSE